jgi:hypothetical protein
MRQIILKAEAEIAEKRFWRAKEILSGAIPNAGYSAELFHKLGAVLLKMGDLPEAGKYLFLSGVRKPAYEEAISLFLDRYSRNGLPQFLSVLPASVRHTSRNEWPPTVVLDLVMVGLLEGEIEQQAKDERERKKIALFPGWDRLIGLLWTMGILIFPLLLAGGLYRMFEIAWKFALLICLALMSLGSYKIFELVTKDDFN